jgi:hemerythrin superfamily protein
MATSAGKAPSSSRAKSGKGSTPPDAIELLKADHRQVEEWFEEFQDSDDDETKQDLATRICAALRVHTAIEEEIFYPAFLAATDDTDMNNEAIIEHAGAKHLIEEIEATGPGDEFFDARVKVLSEMIKHHVHEEERPGGMFAEAKKSDLDLEALGTELQQRKQELADEEA